MEAVNTHITQNNKTKHTFAIYRLLRTPSCKHAHWSEWVPYGSEKPYMYIGYTEIWLGKEP